MLLILLINQNHFSIIIIIIISRSSNQAKNVNGGKAEHLTHSDVVVWRGEIYLFVSFSCA